MNRYPDPRFDTDYLADYRGIWFQNSKVLTVPSVVLEKCDNLECCQPGYRQKRPDKGYDLSVDDYPLHPVKLSGGMWPDVVYPPKPRYHY
jgi:hypothetical protein